MKAVIPEVKVQHSLYHCTKHWLDHCTRLDSRSQTMVDAI